MTTTTLHTYRITTDTGMPITFLAHTLAEARALYGPEAQPVAKVANAHDDTHAATLMERGQPGVEHTE